VYMRGVQHTIPIDVVPTKLLCSNVTNPNPTTNSIPKTLILSLLSVGTVSASHVRALYMEQPGEEVGKAATF